MAAWRDGVGAVRSQKIHENQKTTSADTTTMGGWRGLKFRRGKYEICEIKLNDPRIVCVCTTRVSFILLSSLFQIIKIWAV